MAVQWKVFARDNRTLTRVAEVDDYTSLDFTSKFNDISTWELQLPGDVALSAELTAPWTGIEVVRREDPTASWATVLAGPLRSRSHERTRDTNRITLSGVSDTVWLANRLASPQPGTAAPPYDTTAYDVRTGVASTVMRAYVTANLGTGALGPRQVPGVTLPTESPIGLTVTGRGRWNNLLELLQQLATDGGGLGFGLAQEANLLAFRCWAPRDFSASVKFGIELGNLAAYKYESTRPDANYVVVGGSGEGTLRLVKEVWDGAEVAAWGRIEDFRDRRDSSDFTELAQAGTETLTDKSEKASLSITPIDNPGQRFVTDYFIGDKVTVVVDGTPIQEVVREVKVHLAQGELTTEPLIGTPNAASVFGIFQRYRELARKVSNLDRR